jgi:hypothetical protein
MSNRRQRTAISYASKRRKKRAKQIALFKRRQAKAMRRRRRQKGRRKEFSPKPVYPAFNAHTASSVTRTADCKLCIELPRSLDFEDNYESTASHFAVLRKAVCENKPIKHLRFDNIESITPSAALVLASEVDRWNQKVNGRLNARLRTWNEEVKRLLCQMGYFELLGLKKPDAALADGNTTFLRFRRGYTGQDGGALAKQLRVDIEKIVGESIQKQFLFEGLSEAITNVGQHAYQNATSMTLRQWWLSASYQREERKLCVTFFDQGEGIPKTLPRSYFFETIKDAFHLWTDAQKIAAAMEVGRSSTKKEGRGMGLQNLVEFAKAHKEGQLSIYSLHGMYRRNFAVDGLQHRDLSSQRNHLVSVGGTLIEWSVTL